MMFENFLNYTFKLILCASSVFQELNLSGIGLTSVPSVTWETANLIKLDLSKNSIDKLPDELSSCSHLQV